MRFHRRAYQQVDIGRARGVRAHERPLTAGLVDQLDRRPTALAGLREVQVVHGRGTGALRTAIREELDRHPLVHGREGESAEGATVALLAPREQTALSP